jgi:hypothetical protein
MRYATALPTNYTSDLKQAAFIQWWSSYHRTIDTPTPKVDEGSFHRLRDPQVYPRMWLIDCTIQQWAAFSEWATVTAAPRVRSSSAVAIFVNANWIELNGRVRLIVLEPREMSRVEADRFARGWWDTAIASLTPDLSEVVAGAPQLAA